MSECNEHYELWALTPDKDWVCYASMSFDSARTKDDAIAYATSHVDDRPTQLMRVLPGGRWRIALWIDKTPVPINTIP